MLLTVSVGGSSAAHIGQDQRQNHGACRREQASQRRPKLIAVDVFRPETAGPGWAQKEANRVLRERKRAELRAKLDERVRAAKQKLHID